MLTENEAKILKMLLTAFGEEYSINHIAKQCRMAPNGAFKILRKLEKEGILESKQISHIKSYKLNFDSEKTKSIVEIALYSDIKGRIKFRYDDLKPLKDIAAACIIFGSYIDMKKEPNDLDIMFIIEKDKFKAYKEALKAVYPAMPIKVHDVLQTEEDIKKNILNKDKTIIQILRTGIILWGHKKIVEVIGDDYKR